MNTQQTSASKIEDLPPAKSQRHELHLRICMDDFRGDFAGRRALETTFELIEKVKAAVFSKGGKIMSFKFDNTPTRDANPGGDIATLSFDIRTPYHCVATLEYLFYSWVEPLSPQGHQSTVAINFKVQL